MRPVPQRFVAAAIGLLAAHGPAAGSEDPQPMLPTSTVAAHNAAVLAVAFAPDGKSLATAGDDRLIKLWALPPSADAAPLAVFDNGASNSNVLAFSPDGSLLAALGGTGGILVLDVRAKKAALDLKPGVGGSATAVAIAPDGKTLVAVARGRMVLFSLPDGTLKAEVEVHPGYAVNAVAAAPTDATAATTGSDSTTKVHDLASGRELKSFAIGSKGTHVAFTPDGAALITTSEDRKVRRLTLATDHAEELVEEDDYPMPAFAVAPDGRYIVLAGSDAPRLLFLGQRAWHPVRYGVPRADPGQGHASVVRAVAVSRDGSLIASGDKEGRVCLWPSPSTDPPPAKATR